MNDRLVALIDMDCFYCQVETRLNPSLNGKPLAVVQYNQWKGGGIIAVNYEARDRGVTRHMRGDEAKKHCPEIQLVSVPAVRGKADLTKYRDAGREVIKVLCEFSDCVQRASVDEAYIDLSEAVEEHLAFKVKVTPSQLENTFVVGYSPEDNDEDERERGVISWLEDVYNSDLCDPGLHRLATATALVEKMRAAVFEKTGFRCSAGISHNKILAKLVCGLHKPNRQTVLPMSSVADLYRTLPVKKVRNLGGKLGDDVVEKLGITHMSELANFTEKQLQAKYDEKTGTWLYNIARGIDLDPVTPRLVSKSIGCCKKFPGKTALRTKQNVTHWLSELASEVAERLDEDIHMNKRKAQLLTIHFSQELDGRDVAMSRSVVLPGYEAEKIAACAFAVLGKHSSSQSDDTWHPPLKYLGLSAGKFMEYSGNTNASIDKFFKTVPSTATSSKKNSDDTVVTKPLQTVDNSEKEVTLLKEKVDNQKNEEKTSAENNKACTKPNGQVSFFERYFKNHPNKILKKSSVKQTTTKDTSTTLISQLDHKQKIDETNMDTTENYKFMNENVSIKLDTRVDETTENGDESWISPSEIFPDLEDIDDSVLNILPSPLQRKISNMKNLKKEPFLGCKNDGKLCVSSLSRTSTESDCAPTRIETVVDIHTASTSVLEPRARDETESDLPIEPEGLFDTTSIDVFELEESNEKPEEDEVCDECRYCKQQIPLCDLQEHLDHHVAEELHKELNSEANRTNQVRTNKTVTVISDKKKRGRPGKKDVVPPKKSRTIMSFFTKS